MGRRSGPSSQAGGFDQLDRRGIRRQADVVETWESKAHQEKFMHNQLGPALAEAKVAQPTRVEWFNNVIDFHLG